MIPTRRRNPWAVPSVVLLLAWIALIGITLATDVAWAAPGQICALVLFVISSNLYRLVEDESAREVAAEVYGRTMSQAWTRGFNAGLLEQQRRDQR
jgi:hypothetical protein